MDAAEVNALNSEIYRNLVIAYELRSDEVKQIWRDAGYDFSTSYVRRMALSPSHENHAHPSERQLKEWLSTFLTAHLNRTPETKGLGRLLREICDSNGVEYNKNHDELTKLILQKRGIRIW